MTTDKILRIVINAQDNASTTLAQFNEDFEDIFKKIQVAAGIASATIVGFSGATLKHFSSIGEELMNLSTATGISVEALSALRMKASDMGLDLSTITSAIKRMEVGLGDMASNSTKAAEVFAPLKIQFSDLKGLRPEEQFIKIGNAIASIEDPFIRAKAAQDLFGRGFEGMIPLFENGTLDLKELENQAKETGQMFDRETMAKALATDNAFDKLNSTIEGLRIEFASALAPALIEVTDTIVPIIRSVKEWIEKNPELTEQIVKWTTVALALVAALNPITVAIGSIIAVLLYLDTKIKDAGMTWSEFGASVAATWAETWWWITYYIDLIIWQLRRLTMATDKELKDLAAQMDADLNRQWQDVQKAYININTVHQQGLKEQEQIILQSLRKQRLDIEKETGEAKRIALAIWQAQVNEAKAKYQDMRIGTLEELQKMAEDAKLAGDTTNSNLIAAWDKAKTEAANAGQAIADNLTSHLENAARIAGEWGRGFVQNFIGGILNQIPALQSAVSRVVSILNSANQSYGSSIKTVVSSGSSTKKRAYGGAVNTGEIYTVGEFGTELFVPRTDGYIIPNSRLGGVTINIMNNQFLGEEGIAEKLGNRLVQILRRTVRI